MISEIPRTWVSNVGSRNPHENEIVQRKTRTADLQLAMTFEPALSRFATVQNCSLCRRPSLLHARVTLITRGRYSYHAAYMYSLPPAYGRLGSVMFKADFDLACRLFCTCFCSSFRPTPNFQSDWLFRCHGNVIVPLSIAILEFRKLGKNGLHRFPTKIRHKNRFQFDILIEQTEILAWQGEDYRVAK